jgi:hypothetical protein
MDVVQRAKSLLAEASTPPWRLLRLRHVETGNEEAIVAPNAPSENDRFYEGLHLVCESVFHAGDRAFIVQAPDIVAELVQEVERLREAILTKLNRDVKTLHENLREKG